MSLLSSSAIIRTPAERAMGRLMRAPDHPADPAGDPPPVDPAADPATPPADPVDPATPPADPADPAPKGTALGGDDPADPADPAAAEPVIPETYDLKLADDQPVDAEVVEMAAPVLKELKLSQDAAQKLMPFAKEIADRSAAGAIAKHTLDQAQAFQAQTHEWLENAKGDSEIGGQNWDKSIAASAKALDLLGMPKGSPFRTLLNETGLGNHPEMIRAFARIGAKVSEDSFARTDTTPAGKPDRLAALYPADVPKEGA